MRSMKYYFGVFFWICFPIMVLGLLAGTLNMMSPKAVYIPNGEPGPGFEGIDGVIAAVLSASIVGIIFGVLGLFIAMFFGVITKKMIEAKIEPAITNQANNINDNIGDDR